MFNYLGDVAGSADDGKYFIPDSRDGFSSGLDYQSEKDLDGPDLAINCLIDGGRFSLWLNYNADLFAPDTAEGFASGILEEIKVLSDWLNAAEEKVITASDLGETAWSEEEFRTVVSAFAARKEQLERIYPLTPLQEGMLLSHVMDPTSPAYRLVDIYELDFLPTEASLRAALDALAEKHEVLRTAIIHKNVSVPRQAITSRKPGLTMKDISGEKDGLAYAYQARASLLKDGFDLQDKPLFSVTCLKTSENSCYLVTAAHHIIVDGWCVSIYLRDFEKFLREAGAQSGKPSFLPGEAGIYESSVRELLRKDQKAAIRYYRNLLSSYDNKASIPSYGPIPPEEVYGDNRLQWTIPPESTALLDKLCRGCGTTLADGMLLIWGLTMQTACRMDDVVFAKVVSGRDNLSRDVSDVVGLFINSVPVRLRTEQNATALSLLQDLHQQSMEGSEYDFCPLSDIQKAVGMNEGLIYSVLSFENYDGENLSLLKPILEKEEQMAGMVAIDATTLPDGSISVLCSFDPLRYRKAEIERLFALMENTIRRLTASPALPVRSLPLMTEEDEAAVISLSQGEKLPFDNTRTYVDYFRDLAEKDPEAVAVTDGRESLTRRQLDEASDRVASWLLDRNVNTGDFVAVQMSRMKEYIAVTMGINKAGAAYMPIDLDYPADRAQYMLEDSEAKIVFTDELAREVLAVPSHITPKDYRLDPANRAYMIYTSGSTGKPKGVVTPHRALLNLIMADIRLMGVKERFRIAFYQVSLSAAKSPEDQL